jgi:hypothetical protein
VSVILEDLTMLSPKRLEKRLEALARDAVPCRSISVFEGNSEHGLTVALHIDSRRRADVLDLARVVEDDAAVSACCGWSLLTPSRRHAHWCLLLRVSFDRPATCEFAVAVDLSEHPKDPLSADLPLLLAADRFVFDFDGRLDPERPLVWIAAPAARECVFEVLSEVGL